MDELFALPIKGESFLLRRGAKHVLVDGGYNGRALALAIAAHDSLLSKIDVVVCTHADRDHAGGLATLLDHWRVTKSNNGKRLGEVGQFWLPGSWADVLPELMFSARDFVDGLIASLDEFATEEREFARSDGDLEDVATALDALVIAERLAGGVHDVNDSSNEEQRPNEAYELFDSGEADLGPTEPIDEPRWFADIRKHIDDIVRTRPEAVKALASGRRRIRYRVRTHRIGRAFAEAWLSLIDTAEIIRAIAEQVIQHGIRVRWFDFDAFAQTRLARGGAPGFLIPLNAVEQAPSPRLNLSYLARLSPINEACLAFLAPPTLTRLGVIFCGDSPLGDGPAYSRSFLTPFHRSALPIIATAPHHGSENNSAAYHHLGTWANVCLWLRTGGSIRQPGPAFKALGSYERICTHCPQTDLKLTKAGVAGWYVLKYGIALRVTGHHCTCR